MMITLKELKFNKKYQKIKINDFLFERVIIFNQGSFIEIVHNWGSVTCVIDKKDIKNIIVI